MQASAIRDPNRHAGPNGLRPPRLVRVVAPGVCYILAQPKDIARVLAARPGARIQPLAEGAA